MKADNENIHRKVEDTLSSIDNLETATPKPYFYGRLMNRLHEANKGQRSPDWTNKMRVAVVMVVLMLIVNLYVAFNYDGQTPQAQDEFGAFLTEYSMETGDIYETND